MKIKVNKIYLQRDGEQVEIVGMRYRSEEGPFPFLGDNGHSYSEFGKYDLLKDSPKDLISEVKQ